MFEAITIRTLDYILLPFFIVAVYAFAYRFRDLHYPKQHPWRKYFIPALSVKLFGAIFIGMIYAYYYKWGDTYNYFFHSRVINSAFEESPIKWFNLLFRIPDRFDSEYYEYIRNLEWYTDPASYTVGAIAAIFGIFTFSTYLPTAALFAALSFTGTWALFRTFVKVYPELLRPIAIATLFIPSVFVWGSGIFKDTICMFGIGWLTYGTFRMLIEGNFKSRNIILTISSFLLIAFVKIYILIAYFPAMLTWAFFKYMNKITNASVRFLVRYLLLALIIGGTGVGLQELSKGLGKYSIDKLATTSQLNRKYIFYISGEEGSAYSLGDIDPTLGGMLAKFPQAVNVTFFRPYLWEIKKPIVVLSAIEAIISLFVTLKIIFGLGLKKIIDTIRKEATVQFSLIFAIIFAFAVGISSYNFGTLSRYKIPSMPFLALAMILIWYKNKPLNKKLIGFLNI
jgi:hypothetical protein